MYVIYMTPEFLKDLHLSVNVFISEEMLEISRPYIELSDHEIAQELRYLKIIRSVLSGNSTRPSTGTYSRRLFRRCSTRTAYTISNESGAP